MKHRKISTRVAVAAAAAAVAALAPAPAMADVVTSTGTLSGGALSLSSAATPTFSAALDGTDKAASFTLPMTLTDATGLGDGWNVTLTSTQFSTGGVTPRTLATNASTVTGSTAACVDGSTCTAPDNAIGYPLNVPAAEVAPAGVKLFNASVGKGMGKFTLTPTVAVAVPANVYAGEYTSTLTVAGVSGP
jgi:hypothetical protein